MVMNTTVISKIEQSIFALPLGEQRRLLARVSKKLRKREEAERDAQLRAMANDPAIQKEIRDIEREFMQTELDGLPE
jgi:hypothetical protein